jgi:hypothetical protein
MAGICPAGAQTAQVQSLLGTVAAFQPEALKIEITLDAGPRRSVSISPETLVQKIAPGEKSLKAAQRIEITAIHLGDRVLVSLRPGTEEALRIVVMPAREIASQAAEREAATKAAWTQHGMSGVVASKSRDEIVLKLRNAQAGAQPPVVKTTAKTVYRRYAPDTVRFDEAKPSALGELKPGDQLRARGTKSADGLTLEAEEIVFGAFQLRAGTITAVEAEAGTLTVKDYESGKPFTVKVATDTRIKRMPSFGPPAGGAPGTGMAGRPAGGFPGGRPGMSRAGGGPDLSQMVEHMPLAKLADFKPGETIVASSVKGPSAGQITAIMLLGNAERILQLATARSESQIGLGGMGSGGGLGGLDLSSMMP